MIGELLVLNALTLDFNKLKINKDPRNPLTGKNPSIYGLQDYDQLCGISTFEKSLRELTIAEFDALIASGEEYQLIDVREHFEYDIVNMDGLLIPLGEIAQNIDKIDRDKKVVVHCKSGKRSIEAMNLLQDKYDFDNLYNLKGGIVAYYEIVRR